MRAARQYDAILCGHQGGVAGDDRLVAQIVLFDPGDPIPAQRWCIVTDERFWSRVAGLREQCGAQTQGEIGRSRNPVGQMRKCLREAGS